MKYKLLVEQPHGQEVIEVSESGSFYDESKVLWDERIDGELIINEAEAPYLSRSGDLLSIDQIKKDSYDAKVAADAAIKYRDDRRGAHSPIGDQLDMIYWDMKNGTTTFVDYIDGIKSAHPKP